MATVWGTPRWKGAVTPTPPSDVRSMRVRRPNGYRAAQSFRATYRRPVPSGLAPSLYPEDRPDPGECDKPHLGQPMMGHAWTARPNARSSHPDFIRWCAAHRLWRFDVSSLPPWTLGTMWSTSVAGRPQGCASVARLHWQAGWRSSCFARRFRHSAPYPRCVVVPPPQDRQRPRRDVTRRQPGHGCAVTARRGRRARGGPAPCRVRTPRRG